MITKGRFNKSIAMVMSAALILGLAPAFPDMSIKSYAGTNIDTAPSVQAYADKATLMGEKFAPGNDGTNKTVGLLYFGTNGTDPQKWYILGKDDQVKDKDGNDTDNIAIFAASNITTNCFYKDTSNHDYAGDDDEAYVTGSDKPSSVYANHYGESNIREALRRMAADGDTTYNYFTATEKAMMQKTKVLTHEYSNNRLYTTSDRLYLASVNTSIKKIINVGSARESEGGYAAADEYTSIKLNNENYWNTGTSFWLRSPYADGDSRALTAIPKDGSFNRELVSDHISVRPASNLNLKDVLFASAAPAAASIDAKGGTITTSEADQDAMTLRLDGSGKNIGTFTYSTTGITVEHGSTDSKVSLVVQGNNGTCDWYYCKQISSTYKETINTGAIASAVNAGTGTSTISADDIKLTDASCKIWLEIPDDDSRLSYAVADGTRHTHTWSDKSTPYDGEQHGYACTDTACPDKGKAEGFNDLEDHTYGDGNFCVKCGYSKDGHIVTHVSEKAPTSSTVGYKEHYECSHCGNWFIYPAALGILTEKPKSYFEIPATGSNDSSSRNSERYSGSGSGSSGGGSASSSTGISIIGTSGTSGTWVKDNTGWRYEYTGGTYATGSNMNNADGKEVEKITWIRINNADYAFGSDAYLKTGWVIDNTDSKWYYCDVNKGRLYGWYYDTTDGYWYCLDANTGAMLTGWQLIGGKQYYFAQAPAAATYAFDESSSKWVYSNASNYRPYGSMYAGTTTPDNHRVDESGARVE